MENQTDPERKRRIYGSRAEERDLNKKSKYVDKIIYQEPWFTYIVKCRDGTLYVGVTKDVDKRIEDHNSTNRCRYTRFRKPLKLVYKELCVDYNTARKRESEIKRFSRKKKLELIAK
jgi:putative endonuclease